MFSQSNEMRSFHLSGVWQQRFVPVVHQHIGGPSVRPTGPGSHLRRTRRGGRFRQPLFQNLPLPAVAAADTTPNSSSVWGNQQNCTHLSPPSRSFLGHTVVPSVVSACFKKQLGLNQVWYLQGITHNHVHIPLLGSSNSTLVWFRIYDGVVGELENTSLTLVSTGTGWTLSKVTKFVT